MASRGIFINIIHSRCRTDLKRDRANVLPTFFRLEGLGFPCFPLFSIVFCDGFQLFCLLEAFWKRNYKVEVEVEASIPFSSVMDATFTILQEQAPKKTTTNC